MRAPDPALVAYLSEELSRPAMPEAMAFAAHLAKRPGVAAVLFYGSCLQRSSTEGLLDFYVLTDVPGAYGQSRVIEAAGKILPPNVYPEGFEALKAKAAVVTVSGFRARMGLAALDTTFWARFCQRAALLYVRDEAARVAAVEAVASAVETASIWAARLSPETDGPAAWRALFAKTYKVEIRVERPGRAADIVGVDEARFAALWSLTTPARNAAPAMPLLGWPLRWWAGKLLHIARLAKAAFTYEGGPTYLLWKIRRHRRR